MHLHESVFMNWILLSAEMKNKENQSSAKQKDNDDLYNVTFSNELKNLNKNEKMTTNSIHTLKKDVDESLNMMKTAETAFCQFKH